MSNDEVHCFHPGPGLWIFVTKPKPPRQTVVPPVRKLKHESNAMTDVKKELSEVNKSLVGVKRELLGLGRAKEIAIRGKKTVVARHALLELQLQNYERINKEVDHQRTFHSLEAQKMVVDIRTLTPDQANPRILDPIIDAVFFNIRLMDQVVHRARRDREIMAGLSNEISRVYRQMDLETRQFRHFHKQFAQDFKETRKRKALLEERRDNLMAQLSLAKKRALRRNERVKNERQMKTRGRKAATQASNSKTILGAKSVRKSKQ